MELWDIKIDDLFKANLENLKAVYSKDFTQMKNYMTFEELMLLTRETEIDIIENKIKLAYAYSKMTIVDEQKDREKYYKIEFPEFLEFIGRIALLQLLYSKLSL